MARTKQCGVCENCVFIEDYLKQFISTVAIAKHRKRISKGRKCLDSNRRIQKDCHADLPALSETVPEITPRSHPTPGTYNEKILKSKDEDDYEHLVNECLRVSTLPDTPRK